MSTPKAPWVSVPPTSPSHTPGHGTYSHAARGVRWKSGLLLLIVLCVLPFFFYPVLLMHILCMALFAAALNLLLGYVGILSFGQAAFLGSAAYLTGYAIKAWGWPTPLGVLLGVGVALVLGCGIGLLAIRRQGIYFTMITLALAQLVYFFCVQAPFTGGEDGLQGIPRGTLLGLDLSNDLTLYYVVLVVCLAGFAGITRIVHSPFGQVLKAVRGNETRVFSLGYDVARYKLLAFVLAAGLTGLAGALKTVVFSLASLTDVSWGTSGAVVLMVVIGGIGTRWGPVVGAVIFVVLEHELADKAGALVPVIMGAIFVACVLLFRRGVVGEVQALWERLTKKPPHP